MELIGNALTLRDLVAYNEGSVVSKTLIDKKIGTVTIFSFGAGQGLSEHTVPYDAFVQIVDGEAEVTINGEPHTVAAGQMIIMPANIPHEMKAVKPFKMLLVMIKDSIIMSDKTAVLLLQMGGPDSLDAVEPFLYNLFSDRDIIKIGPAFLQPFIARMIVKRRAPKSVANYRDIGGKSPLRALTEQQASELEKVLGDRYRCFVAMRYWKPFTDEALNAIRMEGIQHIIALSLYPHYSRATSGSSFNELERRLAGSKTKPEVSSIRQFYDHPLYIQALAEKIEQGLSGFPDRSRVQIFFSAHSLPQSFIDEGDPYLDHIQATVRLTMERFEGVAHHLAFQSRAGPVKWLEPSTQDKLKELAALGHKQVLVVPLSFVSDHIETLHEIDIEYSEEAHKLGIADFRRMESLNSSPTFIRCLAELVRAAEK